MKGVVHPLLGRDPLLTQGTLFVLVVLCIASVLQYLQSQFAFVDDAFLEWVWVYDGFVGALILSIIASWILAILYAWVNGGPALATLLAFGPTVTGALVRMELALTIDLALSAAVATLAVWLAAWVSYSPDEPTDGTVWAVALGGVVTAFGFVAVYHGLEIAGPNTEATALLANGLLGTGIIFGVLWVIGTWRASP